MPLQLGTLTKNALFLQMSFSIGAAINAFLINNNNYYVIYLIDLTTPSTNI